MQLGASDLGHRFPPHPWLFQDLSFSLSPGQTVGLGGPSGSGKTTMLGILAGWVAPRAGCVYRHGIDKIGWVFQNPIGVARRTAIDHVSLPLLARGARRRDAEGEARRLLDAFELTTVARREFRTLSGGEAQRLMLARAVATRPDLLLVDEPTAQLDPQSAAAVAAVLGALALEQMLVVVASHDPKLLEACTDMIQLGTA